MKSTGKRVIDRVQLILEIFALHAGSREAKLQIEMARVKHELPLVREWIRRSKMGELPGFLGPGRYAIDAYYRHLTGKLARMRRDLEKIRSMRRVRRASRKKLGFPQVAIVGYASAGKTSLFNVLSGESKPVGREYFTTLHPKHKLVRYLDSSFILVDTVGFIRDIPPEVIEAFYATLEEISDSDLILFVVDVSDPDNLLSEKIASGLDILARIGASTAPTIIVLNKIDLINNINNKINLIKTIILNKYDFSVPLVPVSTVSREGLNILLDTIRRMLPNKSGRESGVKRIGSDYSL